MFDPIGLLTSVLLQGKMVLGQTWEGNCKVLGWDEPLPKEVTKEITELFIDLYKLESVEFPHSLWPMCVVQGNPELVVFSDGSIAAFGAVIYIRWRMDD